jgi:hypothetical protein
MHSLVGVVHDCVLSQVVRGATCCDTLLEGIEHGGPSRLGEHLQAQTVHMYMYAARNALLP